MNSKIRLLLLVGLLSLVYACKTTKKVAKNVNENHSFSTEQMDLVMGKEARIPMRVFKINNHSDSILLRQKCKDVDPIRNAEVLNRLAARMLATVRDSMSLGVGIAAPQVGILKNMVVVQRFDKEGFPFETYLNPKIVQYSKMTQECREGCLSIPERSDTLNSRSYAILIEYDRLDNSHHIEMVEDFVAVIFQHEIDHLNGILYVDHLEKELREGKK